MTEWLAKREGQALGAVAILAILLANGAFFYSQYLGAMIFPWDFTSAAYHAQSVAWLRHGGILSPPEWYPYGSMGFPAWWSLQSSAWYLPVQIVDWFGIDYTLFAAARLQSFHVAVGATGVLFLARVCGARWDGALLAALIYHFSSIFYSNQQHVDIVRGAALLPFLLLVLHPNVILRSRLAAPVAIILIWQFLVSAYPGIIVAGFYTVAGAVAWWLAGLERTHRGKYLCALALVGAAGALIAMAKWWTPIIEGRASYVQKQHIGPMWFSHIWTFLFPHDAAGLPGDITMRSLWSPPIVLFMAPFIRSFPRAAVLPLGLVVLALVGGMNFNLSPDIRGYVPGWTVSRFPHSDWRPTLHLGLALLTAILWPQMLAPAFDKRMLVARCAALMGGIAAISLAAVSFGYTVADIGWDITLFFALIGALGTIAVLATDRWRTASFFTAFVAFALASSILQYFVHAPGSWRTPWSGQTEAHWLGSPIAELIADEVKFWPRRPARLDYGTNVWDEYDRLSMAYNRAWYSQEFALFGYDNLSPRGWYEFIRNLETPPHGNDILQFMRRPSQFMITAGSEFDPDKAAACADADHSCTSVPGADARMFYFGVDSYGAEINAPAAESLHENELWYSGWKATLCSPTAECTDIAATADDVGLRTWAIPQGRWIMRAAYEQPGRQTANWMVLAGLALLATSPILARHLMRRP
jgi:hypothetical protein